MSNAPSPAGAPQPPPKPRIAPKLGLRGMADFVKELRLRARMSDGQDASEAWLLLEPSDLERLDDVAEVLDWLYFERARRRKNQ